jgi:yeast amino acid transporter
MAWVRRVVLTLII